MKLFMITVLPLSLVYMLTKNDEQSPGPYTSVLAGFIFGALYSFIDCMFTPSYYLIRYAFFPNYGFYLLFEVILPLAACIALYLIFIKNRSQILLSLGFAAAAFYAVYMPARIIHRNDVFDWYLLFVKPLIYTSMVAGLKRNSFLLYKTVEGIASDMPSPASVSDRVRPFILPVSLIFCVLIIPPVIDVMNLLNLPLWTVIPAAAVYCAFAVFGKKILKRIH